ncbi:MAG: ATP-dependent 6-phosphofructokinase [Planctomycetes bacterium]|nr:ATP-dependent 6-phosphofructokinase [Planctomycetota bacterium]
MKIGILTSGGDAPGMNAAIRAIVRSANQLEWEVYGIFYGFHGLCEKDITGSLNNFKELHPKDVAHVLGRGGTFLKSARYHKFQNEDTRKTALKNLHALDIKCLVVIGGDGSFHGSHALYQTNMACGIMDDLRIVCIPATIDNDIPCTKYSIGADTALNTAMECIDKIRDTACSHKRVFLVQIMGRDCDYLPYINGITSGAHIVLGAHDIADINKISQSILDGFSVGKDFVIIIVAEGLQQIKSGSTGEIINIRDEKYSQFTASEMVRRELVNTFPEEYKDRVRPIVLGHVQRGGEPSVFDRVLATRFGVAAVKVFDLWDEKGDNQPVMLAFQNEGETNDKIVPIPLQQVLDKSASTASRKYRFLNQLVIRGVQYTHAKWPDEL